jgi:hypothetical protein
MTDQDLVNVVFVPTDPVETARACVMEAIVKYRGDYGVNLVRDYGRHLDEVFLLKFAHSGYKPEQVEQIRGIFQTAKATAIRDGRVFAYLWF